jgi:hypothetical protein
MLAGVRQVLRHAIAPRERSAVATNLLGHTGAGLLAKAGGLSAEFLRATLGALSAFATSFFLSGIEMFSLCLTLALRFLPAMPKAGASGGFGERNRVPARCISW